MAVTLLSYGHIPEKGINYTAITDSSADWSSPTLPNNTYFYDKTDKLPHYKDASGNILEVFTTAGVSSNIYNTDGTLTGPRTVTLGTNGLAFSGGAGVGSIVLEKVNGTIFTRYSQDISNINALVINGTNSTGIYLNSTQFEILTDNGVNTGSITVEPDQISLTIPGPATRSINIIPSGISINGEYTLPNADGSAFQALTTDGAGNLYWSEAITPSSSFIPPIEQSEVRRGVVAVSSSTSIGNFGGVGAGQEGSSVAIPLGGIVPLAKVRQLTSAASTNSRVSVQTGTSGAVIRMGRGFRFIGSYIYSDQSAGGTNWYSTGARQFCGLTTGGSIILPINSTTTVQSRTNIIGIGSDVGDTNLQIFHNANTASATKIDLGSNFPANKTGPVTNAEAYQLELYNAFGSTEVKYRVRKLSNGLEVTGTITTNLPNGVDLGPQIVRTSGSSSENVSIDLIQLTTYTRE